VSTQFILHKFAIFSLCLNVVKSKNFKNAHFQTNDMRKWKECLLQQKIYNMCFHEKCTHVQSEIHLFNNECFFLSFYWPLQSSEVSFHKVSLYSTGICANLLSQVLQSSSIVTGLQLARLPFKSNQKASMIFKSGDRGCQLCKQHISQLSMKDDTTLDWWNGDVIRVIYWQ